MADKEIVISIEEVRGLELRCTNCQSGSVFAPGKQGVHTKTKEQGPVLCCPNCGQSFDFVASILNNWDHLISVDTRKEAPFRLKFHVSQSGDQGTF
jgi:hypothetical protein